MKSCRVLATPVFAPLLSRDRLIMCLSVGGGGQKIGEERDKPGMSESREHVRLALRGVGDRPEKEKDLSASSKPLRRS